MTEQTDQQAAAAGGAVAPVGARSPAAASSAAAPSALDPWMDATDAAALVREGVVSAREMVSAAITRIERLEPSIGALISTRFDKALAEADALDNAPERKRALPFAGAPFLVKDLAYHQGEPMTFGSRLFRDFVASGTDPIVEAAVRAGFIALGKTKTPEFGLISVTEPLLHGPCRNPWDLSISPGGSSGGSAAAVAAGMTPFAQASDGGGSIRIPASACGLVGLKPSRGRGLGPQRGAIGGLSVTFCVSRSVRDTTRFLALSDAARVAAAGDDDPGPAQLDEVTQHPARPLRIAVSPLSIRGDAPDAETAEALRQTAQLCADLGHQVRDAAFEVDGAAGVDHFLTYWTATAYQIERRLHLLRAIGGGWRVWNWPRRAEALDPWTRGLAQWFRDGEARNPGMLDRARAYFRDAARIYEAFFEDYDVMLSPVTRRARIPIGEQAPTRPFEELLDSVVDNIGYTPAQNAIGAPAIALPLHWTADGIPIGLQFAARRHDERTLLELALQLEAAAPWAHRRPRVSRIAFGEAISEPAS